jgi:hypothetical protein
MPRWLSSFLIVVGFLALVAMALLPKNVTVRIDVNDSSHHENRRYWPHDDPQPSGAPRPD